jgi:hypothetical protein
LVAQAAHAAGDEALVEEARRLAAAEVAGLQQASEWKIKGLVTGLLAIPGDASAQRLAEIAATTTFEPLREYAVQRLETLALSRELVARLGRVETTELAEARAVQETVALLSSQVEAVRLQAIRGLAILGATTEVPRLVRLVGEGTELEKKAALEALDLLYRRAAREEDAK